jgi:hypothetical protein
MSSFDVIGVGLFSMSLLPGRDDPGRNGRRGGREDSEREGSGWDEQRGGGRGGEDGLREGGRKSRGEQPESGQDQPEPGEDEPESGQDAG